MSSRISFIRQLFSISKDESIPEGYPRYMEMGRCCKLSDYLDGHAANYLSPEGRRWEDNKPFASGSGFIALNIESGSADSGSGSFIPFFSIARDGEVDGEALRAEVWQHYGKAGETYLTCPMFMNEFALDKIMFHIRVEGGRVASVQTMDLAAFDEDNDAVMKGYASSFVDYLMQFRDNAFIFDWCAPFLDSDRDLWCDIRSVDRDEQFTAHSFYAVMLNSPEEVGAWHSAYGEDLMNVIAIVKSVVIDDVHKAQYSEAVKSAISAIMSRNLSHNLGSHYLYYTKAYLESLADSCGTKGPDIRGVAQVLAYMQARMDYLATIVSNDRHPLGAVSFVSQIYDEFTVDSCSRKTFRRYNERARRTSNFLLSHLVMSENFTRPGILSGDSLPEDGKFRPLEMELKYYDGTRFLDEKEAAGVLAGLNIALPGGTMSKHAFFNILENFIRNSAKYDQDDFKDGKLLITIAVIPREGSYDFVIHDNKGNASKVLPKLEEHLASLRILDWKGAVDRSSKGLKEMLFSSVWMRPSTYEGRGFSEIINLIQSEPDGSRKLDMIRRYGFSFISVGDNLGLLLNLPAFHFSRSLDLGGVKDGSGLASHLLNFSSDIAVVRSSRRDAEALGLSSRMARVYYEEDFRREDFESFVSSSGIEGGDAAIAEDAFRFKGILDRRFVAESGGNIDNVCLWLGDRKDSRRLPRDVSRIVYFERHLRNKAGGFGAYRDYACVDSISGDNFTITLRDQFEAGVTPRGSYRSWNDYILGLKIKESALSRITLIDERLFNRMMEENTGEELSCKNIRVLSARLSSFDGGNIAGVFEGNSFRDGSPRTHFLSIHLGLIEKLIQSEWSWKRWKGESVEGKAARIMEEITGHFAGPDGDIHVCIHSGRGNFSKELAGPLSSFPFLNLSALESAFSNSKYLLCQLFYNTR